jgi:NAD-dependent DNA ligase
MDKLIQKIVTNPAKYIKTVTIDELEKVLTYLADLYYNTEGGSPVSDEIFDTLKEKLEQLDPKNKVLKQLRANSKVDKVKEDLPFYIGSLDKIKPDKDTLAKWLKTYLGPYVVSDKLDGATALIYKNLDGQVKMYSGGGEDGKGQVITHLLKYVVNNTILKKIPNGCAVRGEMIISKENFKQIGDTASNARNIVSGLVNSKTVKPEVAKITEFICYSIVYPLMTQEKQMAQLEEYGFKVPYYEVLNKINMDNLSEMLIRRREQSEYDIDGLVVIDSSTQYDLKEGNPKYGFAFKQVMTDQIFEATVLDVLWKASMDGYLKPRIEIAPTKVSGGVIITYATAINAKFVVDNIIGPGAVVKLIRSGDVIPKILEVLKPAMSGKPKMPDVAFFWNETNVDIIINDIHSEAYKNVTVGKIRHFFQTLGIMYISEGIIKKFVDNGYDTIEKVLEADSNKLEKIDGIGKKMVTKIYSSIKEGLNKAELYVFMAASHLFGRGIGTRKIKPVLDMYPDIMDNTDNIDDLIIKLIKIDGFDVKTATKFAENLAEFKNFFERVNEIYDISHMLVIKKVVKKKLNDDLIFKGKNIVFTGFRNKELAEFIVEQGGTIKESVSGNTSVIIYGPDSENNSKVNKAKQLNEKDKKNIEILTEDEFIKKYNFVKTKLESK